MKRFSKKTVFVSVGILLFCFLFIFPIVIYTRYATSPWSQKIAGMVHFPVLIMWSPFAVVSSGEVQADISSVRKFYENQDFSSVGMRVDFTTEDGKKRLLVRERGILNKDIEDAVIEEIVKDNGETVTDAEVDQNVTRKLHEFGTEDRVRADLERLYGWSLEDFKTKVVKPSLYKEKAQVIFEEREAKAINETASQKMQEALAQLKSGMSFADAVKKYSDGATAQDGGDLGWVDLSQAEPNLSEVIGALKVGERSEVVETSLGYHIVQVNEIRKESGTKLYHVSQIIARKELLADWVNTFIKKTPIWIFLPDYQWNAQTGFVEFSNPVMRDFEIKNRQSENSDGTEVTADKK